MKNSQIVIYKDKDSVDRVVDNCAIWRVTEYQLEIKTADGKWINIPISKFDHYEVDNCEG